MFLITWSTMVNHGPIPHCEKNCLNMKTNYCEAMVNEGPMSHCNKDYGNMKINHRQSWLAMVQHHIVKELSQHEN